jgi:hypothetical protein
MEIKPKTTVTSKALYGVISSYPFPLINQISTARHVNQWSLTPLIFDFPKKHRELLRLSV